MDTQDETLPDESKPYSEGIASRVLSIMEVLNGVMSFSDPKQCARCIRVCKAWKDTCMAHAWFVVSRTSQLFSILAPMKTIRFRELPDKGEDEDEDEDEEFKQVTYCRPLTLEDWARMKQYSTNIARMTVDDWDPVQFSDGAFFDIATAMRFGWNIFPRLKKLKTVIHYRPIVARMASFFLHDHLRELDVSFMSGNDVKLSMLAFLEEASRIASTLQTLKISGNVTTEYEIIDLDRATLPKLILRWQHLHKIDIAFFMEGIFMLQSLSELQSLEEVHLRPTLTSSVAGRMKAINGLLYDIKPTSFQNLRYLDFQCSLGSFNTFFPASVIFPSLLDLNINMFKASDPLSLGACLMRLVHSCPSLSRLSITMYDNIDGAADPGWSRALNVLHSLNHIAHFRIERSYPISLSNDELIHLVEKIPGLRTLHLNPEPLLTDLPSDTSRTLPSISVLDKLAQVCPVLEELSLYVRTGDARTVESKIKPFPNLKKMSFGTSSLSDADTQDVLVLLGQVLPKNCEIDCQEVRTESDFQGAEPYVGLCSVARLHRVSWIKVKKDMPLVMRIRSIFGNSCSGSCIQ